MMIYASLIFYWAAAPGLFIVMHESKKTEASSQRRTTPTRASCRRGRRASASKTKTRGEDCWQRRESWINFAVVTHEALLVTLAVLLGASH